MNDIALSQQENRTLATLAEMARALLGDDGKAPLISENQHGGLRRPGQRAIEPRARRSKWIRDLERATFPPVVRESLVQNVQIAKHQASLLVLKGFRAVMSDIDRRRADVAKTLGACAQAEIDIFEIASFKIFREPANGAETVARNIKTEADAARHVDCITGIGSARDPIHAEDLLIALHRIEIVRSWKRKDVAIV